VAVLLVESRESLETDVKSSGAVPFGKVGDEKLRLGEALLERLELEDLGHLDLGEETAGLVLAKTLGVANGEGVGA
jgi:hypothetical protein